MITFLVVYCITQFVFFSLVPVILFESGATALHLALLTADYFNVLFGMLIHQYKVSTLFVKPERILYRFNDRNLLCGLYPLHQQGVRMVIRLCSLVPVSRIVFRLLHAHNDWHIHLCDKENTDGVDRPKTTRRIFCSRLQVIFTFRKVIIFSRIRVCMCAPRYEMIED